AQRGARPRAGPRPALDAHLDGRGRDRTARPRDADRPQPRGTGRRRAGARRGQGPRLADGRCVCRAGHRRPMAKLSARERAERPDRAFAYIDSKGVRRLPINDEAHVRNALARFDRVAWENDAARDQARQRLLHAAKRFGIMPVGFITRQLGSSRGAPALPTGTVTFLLTDIEGSTALLQRLGDDYAALLRDVRACTKKAVAGAGGR